MSNYLWQKIGPERVGYSCSRKVLYPLKSEVIRLLTELYHSISERFSNPVTDSEISWRVDNIFSTSLSDEIGLNLKLLRFSFCISADICGYLH